MEAQVIGLHITQGLLRAHAYRLRRSGMLLERGQYDLVLVRVADGLGVFSWGPPLG